FSRLWCDPTYGCSTFQTAKEDQAVPGFKVVIGGLTFAKERIAAGIPHKESPQIIPDATAGANSSACFLLILCHRNKIKLPMHMSIVKYPPK
ncbi:hypothetical protein Leryth_002951, partial [Lithospermum erythrorhizon]